MLPSAVPLQRFELIARRRLQVPERASPVQVQQLPTGSPLDGLEPPDREVVEEGLDALVAKGPNHVGSLLRITSRVNLLGARVDGPVQSGAVQRQRPSSRTTSVETSRNETQRFNLTIQLSSWFQLAKIWLTSTPSLPVNDSCAFVSVARALELNRPRRRAGQPTRALNGLRIVNRSSMIWPSWRSSV